MASHDSILRGSGKNGLEKVTLQWHDSAPEKCASVSVPIYPLVFYEKALVSYLLVRKHVSFGLSKSIIIY